MADELDVIAASEDDGRALPPLADTVLSDMLDDAKEVMFEIINAVLLDSGDKLISKVISVIAQRIRASATGRSYRVDVVAVTVDNETVIFEVQIGALLIMNERSMIYGQKALSSNAKSGQDWHDIAKNLPRVIVITLLDFELRKKAKNFHQVVESTYREEPREVAIDMFAIHNLQLPGFRKIQPDYNKPLHCILKALVDAHDNRLTLKEVVDMNPSLSAYAVKSVGFQQLIDRHELVNSSPKARSEYFAWVDDQMLHNREIVKHRQEAAADAIQEGIGIGRQEERQNSLNMVRSFHAKGVSLDMLVDSSGFTRDEILATN